MTTASPMPMASTAAGYDLVADEYARRLCHELDAKPYDRAFLDRFATALSAGRVLDLGCGPGQVAAYLHARGVPVQGLDLSGEMVRHAQRLHPAIGFEQGDMRRLPFADGCFAGIVAFYSIIHFEPSELAPVFAEMRRTLRPGGWLAASFHIGTEVRHVDTLWGVQTSLDFVFLEPDAVVKALREAGFEAIAADEREPYDAAVEAQTRRCYIVARHSEDPQ